MTRSGQHLARPRLRYGPGHGRRRAAGRNHRRRGHCGRRRGRGSWGRGRSGLNAGRRTACQWRTNGMRQAACRTIRRGLSGSRFGGLLYGGSGGGRLARQANRRSFRSRRRLHCRGWRHGRRGGARFRFRVLLGNLMAEEPPQFDGDVFVDRAGMGLLLGYAQLGELVQNLVRFDFQLPSQLINTNLVHRYKTVLRDAPHSFCEPLSSDSS